MLKGIKGTGLTLGLTNGTKDFAFGGYASNTVVLTKPNAFNTNVNAVDGTTGAITLGNYGITTDSTKSGIETEVNLNIKYVIKF